MPQSGLAPAEVEPHLARRIDGRAIVGHNVSVDWRLLHRRYPVIAPAVLIDTLRLARRLNLDSKNSLSALTAHLGLTTQVEHLALGGQPHRALWDIIATALLLPALIARYWPFGVTEIRHGNSSALRRSSPMRMPGTRSTLNFRNGVPQRST